MKRGFTSRLFAILAVVGLIAGPFASPPMLAAAAQVAATVDDHASMDMPDGMPCCPDTQQKPDCAKTCPFMAACSGIVFPPIATGTTLSAPLSLLAVISPADDPELSGLAQGPPARPPKA